MNGEAGEPSPDARICRLLVDSPAEGAWNMAVDEALLETAARDAPCTLRFYAWSQPTLSLGYFQSHRDRDEHPSSVAVPLVRRSSGGGAILHDQELTYSLIVPQGHALAQRPAELYATVHRGIIAWLQTRGGEAVLCDAHDARSRASEPFLCFQRRASGDVLLRGCKVCGSAQRRRRGAILQHGSLLLARSPAAPELPGIGDLLGDAEVQWPLAHLERIVEELSPHLAARLGLTFERCTAPEAALGEARLLVERQFGAAAWTLRR